MGKALRRGAGDRGGWRTALNAVGGRARGVWRAVHGSLARLRAPDTARLLVLALLLGPRATLAAQERPQRLDRGRFTVVAFPRDGQLARSLLDAAARDDSFPGLPRPREHVVLAIAPDRRRFRQWTGPSAPEWGAAIAFPESRRIVMQGQRAGSDAGDPLVVLRHELAHLALHETMGELPPRWFDEGYASYAAGEWTRDDVLATNVALAVRGTPTLDELEDGFEGGSLRAQEAYALAFRAVAELATLDPQRGLAVFFAEWKRSYSMDVAVREAYGMTLAGFEQRWQQRTRRQYGALALVADVALATSVGMLLMFPFYMARRRRLRERMDALRAADQAAEAEAMVWEGFEPPASEPGEGAPGRAG